MVVGHIVTHLIDTFEEQRQNDPDRHKAQESLTRFHSRKVPNISVIDYMSRIHKYTRSSPACYLIALIYIDRVIQRNPEFALSKYNVHRYPRTVLTHARLLIAALMCAIKFYDDTYYDNEFYSRVGGISCVEMNLLELEILQMLGYGLLVSQEEYEKYITHLGRLYPEYFGLIDEECTNGSTSPEPGRTL